MAENTKGLLDKGDALGEGAARLGQVIESVKRQQTAPVETVRPQSANPLLSESPGEEWAKRFQTQIIGPETKGRSASEFAPIPKRLVLPQGPSEVLAAPRAPEIAPKLAIGAPDLRFGRPEKPKSSWFARVFLGR